MIKSYSIKTVKLQTLECLNDYNSSLAVIRREHYEKRTAVIKNEKTLFKKIAMTLSAIYLKKVFSKQTATVLTRA